MDSLDAGSGLDLKAWEVRTGPDLGHLGERAPAFLGRDAAVLNSRLGSGCRIDGEVRSSVLFPGVTVGKGARVSDSIIMHDTIVGEACQVDCAILDKQCRVGAGAVVGAGDPTVANRRSPTHLDSGITVIGRGASLPPGLRLGKNCIVHPRVDLGRLGVERVADGETVAG